MLRTIKKNLEEVRLKTKEMIQQRVVKQKEHLQIWRWVELVMNKKMRVVHLQEVGTVLVDQRKVLNIVKMVVREAGILWVHMIKRRVVRIHLSMVVH